MQLTISLSKTASFLILSVEHTHKTVFVDAAYRAGLSQFSAQWKALLLPKMAIFC